MGVIVRAISSVSGLTAELSSKLLAANNLSDIIDFAAARTNLTVDSAAEVDAKIIAAKLALGTRYRVADIAGRDALTDLDLADVVFVADIGDGTWATYQPAAVDGTGVGTAWDMLSNQSSSNIATTVFSSESVTVAGDSIVLAFAPKDGVVFNFNTVRNLDGTSIAYDIPVVIDAGDVDGKTFTLQPDVAGQFDGLQVQVQYAHV